ncbi:MAG: dihydrolipoyl dehydrogenase [Chlamydiales bacterium]
MKKQQFDCIIIGGGPGGYVAAIRCAQHGLNTALIEAREMGGTCLNRGCIPSKMLISNANIFRKIRHADFYGISARDVSFNYAEMKQRKDQVVLKIRRSLEGLIKSNKITIFNGFGKFTSQHEVKVMGENDALLEGENIIIATGSEARELPSVPFDYKRIHDSTSLLEITQLPKKFIIIGGGVIGCEFASMLNTFGVDVTILEMLPSIIPTEGKDISDMLTSSFKRQGIKIETGARVQKGELSEKGVLIHLDDGRTFEGDMALVAVGRRFNTSQIGLEKTGVTVEQDGSILTNEQMQTNVAGLYAIGDITGKWVYAHVASHQGIVAADTIAGKINQMSYKAVPSVIFTYPEIGTTGYTLEQAIKAGYKKAVLGKFPFQALGKSQAINETEGFAQIVIDKETGAILGAQVVGYEASTLIAEMAVAIENELTVDSIHETMHAHPTLAEGWLEAALMADDRPLHLPPKVKKHAETS